jgi:BMFP domain-containing protein YqiC
VSADEEVLGVAKRIISAKEEVERAQNELDAVLGAIEVLPREQKRAVSQVVTDASQRLRDVRRELAQLEATLLEGAPMSDGP